MNSLQNGIGGVDGIDRRILEHLFENSRIRTAELARRIGLSSPSTAERLKRLVVTGDDCFIARAHVRSVRHMEELIDRLTPFSMTTTSIIQSSPIERRLPAFETPG